MSEEYGVNIETGKSICEGSLKSFNGAGTQRGPSIVEYVLAI